MVNTKPLKQTLHSSYSMLDGLQGPSGRVRRISPTRGFDLRIVQPIAILFPINCSDTNMYLVKLTGLEICVWSWKGCEVQAVSVCCHPVATAAGPKVRTHSCTIWRTPNPLQVGLLFLISNFRRVLNVVCFLLGNSPASEFLYVDVSEYYLCSIFIGR